MGLNTYPSNPFPPSTDRMDADVLEAEVSKLNNDVSELKSGLTNYQTQNDINLNVPNRKNVLPLDVAKMKVSNHTGTWNGNAYTVGGITFTLNITNGQIVSVVATGTSEDVVTLNGYYNTEVDPTEISFDSDFILNGCPSGGGTETYLLRLWNVGGAVITDTGNGSTLTKGTKINSFDIRIASEYECPSGGITFYPMLRPSFIADATFAPYIPSVESRIEAVESDVASKIGHTTQVTNLDSITAAGVFDFTYSATGNPTNHSGTMLSIFDTSGSWGFQVAKCTTETKIYIRKYDNNAFSNWAVLIDLA